MTWSRTRPGPRPLADGQLDIDYIGLSLITLGLGSLEIVLDRGEQEAWLGSNFIRTFSVLAILGITGAVCWLLVAKKPVVNIRVLATATSRWAPP